MKQQLFYILCILVFGLFSCKKTTLEKEQRDNFTSEIAGMRIWAGSGSQDNYPVLDVFFPQGITRISSTQLVGLSGDTLKYQSSDQAGHTVTFYFELDNTLSTFSTITEMLVYNYATGTLTDDYNYSADMQREGGLQVSAPAYPVNTSLESEVSRIVHNIAVSGTCYDTILYGPTPDSMYMISTNVELTVINDSTIVCNQDFLGIGNDTLHYRGCNTAGNTITFQTYHDDNDVGSFTSLTFNYTNNSYKFEQNVYGFALHDYLSLQ